VFGVASAFTPFLLGTCLGAVSTGAISVTGSATTLADEATQAWLAPFPLITGALALALCVYLAATYLTLEAEGDLREDFRRRALAVWLVAGVLSVGTLVLAISGAPRLWQGLTSLPAGPVVAIGSLLAPASALALWRRRFTLARTLAIGQVVLLLVGWGLAQWPYVVYPAASLVAAAAPVATLRAVLWTLPFGLGLLLPSLALLFAVFKGRNPAVGTAPTPLPARSGVD
jgi:cytochrome d ubiquinol oxidase subunit II